MEPPYLNNPPKVLIHEDKTIKGPHVMNLNVSATISQAYKEGIESIK